MNNYLHELNWTEAKTYVHFAPHEYIVIPKLKKQESIYVKDFLRKIYLHGEIEIKWNKKWIYLIIDNYKYWGFASPLNQTQVTFIDNKKTYIMNIDEYCYNCCTILNRVKI